MIQTTSDPRARLHNAVRRMREAEAQVARATHYQAAAEALWMARRALMRGNKESATQEVYAARRQARRAREVSVRG